MSIAAIGQSVTDSVSTGPLYANQVWYSLENGEVGSSPKDNWDIAFSASGMGSSIHINSTAGTELYVYPNGDSASWSTVDTSGIGTWMALSNSDTSWGIGAFDMTAIPGDPADLGWGTYNYFTHVVTGVRIYVIKLSNGAYQKIWIKSLSSGVYTLRHATLDNNMDMTHTVDKAQFSGKNFAYLSLQNHSTIDREPASEDWDITFTQYTTPIPGFGPYLVSGVLHNANSQVAQVDDIADVASYTDYGSANFSNQINTIGYDWKDWNGTSYDIADSTVYFVQAAGADVWKLVFTDFGGMGTGNYYFTKENVSPTTSIRSITDNKVSLSLYPNPSTRNNVSILFTLTEQAEVQVNIYNMAGSLVENKTIQASNGLNLHELQVAEDLESGFYMVELNLDGATAMQKLIISQQ